MQLERNIFRNSIMSTYPSYMKKTILKQVVDDGLVINDKKKDSQLTLNFTDSIDVSDDNTLDEKISHILDNDAVLSFMEEYEYKKAYRHFCYFKISGISLEKIEKLVEQNKINVFDKKELISIDEFDKPSIYIVGGEIIFKFSIALSNDTGNKIKYVILAVIDKANDILEFRFDKIGLEYKNTYNFYKELIDKKIRYFEENIDLKVENIDFKALVDYIKDKDDITIYAKRMNRNGTTAYLEAFEDEESIIPILGELKTFIESNKVLFESNDETLEIRSKLLGFINDIEVKSDMPMVKMRRDSDNIKFGITHNYKDTEYSLFMLYGELVGEKEMMSNVREYLMQCSRELNNQISDVRIPTEEVQRVF